MDEFGKLCIGAEGIMCGETAEMYRFVVEFVRKNFPNLSLEDVVIVSKDLFLEQGLIVGFGFLNALFIIDHSNLNETGLANNFGQAGTEKLHAHLNCTISTPTESLFEEIVN